MGYLPHTHWATQQGTQQVMASAPPAMYWVDEEVLALRDAIREDVILKVIGCGKDMPGLWDGYGQTLPAFVDMLSALVRLHQLHLGEDKTMKPEQLGRIVGRRVDGAGLDVDAGVVEYIVTCGQRNMIRAGKTIRRLRSRGLLETFFGTDNGRQWTSAACGYAWGLMALRAVVDDVDHFSPEDVDFCLMLMENGPKDSYSFARGFELDLEEEDDLEFPLEVTPMSDELRELEEIEFDEGERMLRALEDRG